MHLTLIGGTKVLLEPGEGLDPSDPEVYLEPLVAYLQTRDARVLLYDLSNVPVIDELYYRWLTAVDTICRISGIQLVTVNMRPAAAYALALMLDEPPAFECALDVNQVE
jgi:hypothetical protein